MAETGWPDQKKWQKGKAILYQFEEIFGL